MTDQHHRPSSAPRKILLREINIHIICTLCGGYYIDATVIIECLHAFCRACIVRHLESGKLCPVCGVVTHKSKPLSSLRSDSTLQALVYKIVPYLYTKEIQRRADFYHSTGVRANSSCSEDSILGDRSQDLDEWIQSNVGDHGQYFSPDDSISLSLEYYRPEDEDKSEDDKPATRYSPQSVDSTIPVSSSSSSAFSISSSTPSSEISSVSDVSTFPQTVSVSSQTSSVPFCTVSPQKLEVKSEAKDSMGVVGGTTTTATTTDGDDGVVAEKCVDDEVAKTLPKRYLRCPAAVTMGHIQKFVRMKFALTNDHRVDIIYDGEVLPSYFSLMDVAYTFTWQRTSPMRFHFRIFVPMPSKPSKVKTEPEQPPPTVKAEEPPKNNVEETEKGPPPEAEVKEECKVEVKSEDRKSKHKDKEKKTVVFTERSGVYDANCVYDYTEPDREEIRAFAERRDREWAMQKEMDEVHFSKKRKKSKHSKESKEFTKRRKIHAEIGEVLSSPDESLKLKLKLHLPNGHRHKHKCVPEVPSQTVAPSTTVPSPAPVSNKEKLLQMRAVRHKNIGNGDDSKKKVDGETVVESKPLENNGSNKTAEKVPESESPREQPPTKEVPKEQPSKEEAKREPLLTGKTLRSDFTNKTSISKEISTRFVNVNLEKLSESSIKNYKKSLLEGKSEREGSSSVGSSKNNMGDNLLNNSQFFSKSFTVSKVESGQKRKAPDSDLEVDKRPSLEITPIHPIVKVQEKGSTETKKAIRPPPPTIPLVRIKKSLNLKTGISIIPKDKCDNIGALDLSKPARSSDMSIEPATSSKEGGVEPKKDKAPETLSNLHLLSESAVQIRELMASQKVQKPIPNLVKKPQIPNLQTLKIPIPQNSKPATGVAPPVPGIRTSLSQIYQKTLNSKNPNFTPRSPSLMGTGQRTPSPRTPLRPPLPQMSPVRNLNPGIRSPPPRPPNLISPNPSPGIRSSGGHPGLRCPPPSIRSPPPSNGPVSQASKTPVPPLTQASSGPRPQQLGIKTASPNPQKTLNPKLLPKIPKLNEINRSQFRLNPQQIRNQRPAAPQNQAIRNIPNPSLLVRQQNQNRINSMAAVKPESEKNENGVTESSKVAEKVADAKTGEGDHKPSGTDK